MNELILHEEFESMSEISSRIARGESVTEVAKALGIKRAVVVEQYEKWKQIATNDEVVRERARSVLAEADDHYSQIIKEFWSLIEEADAEANMNGMKLKNSVLKNVADVTAKRVEFLQRAGLIDDAAAAEHYAEIEEKAEAIKDLLKEVGEQFPEARAMIAEGLGKIFKRAEGIIVGEVS